MVWSYATFSSVPPAQYTNIADTYPPTILASPSSLQALFEVLVSPPQAILAGQSLSHRWLGDLMAK
jgi:hypothetical protein